MCAMLYMYIKMIERMQRHLAVLDGNWRANILEELVGDC